MVIKMNKITTFIVPAYNVENYLEKGLRSFLNLEVIENLEVIIVNDGSTDHTEQIALRYAEKYPSVFKLLNKENGGHGSAINLGSSVAVGKYFKIIDGDDWVINENLSLLVRCLAVCEADVVLTPYHMVDMNSGEKIVQRMYIENYNKLYNLDQITANWKSFDRCMTFHGITYKTSFYNQYRHELPEGIFYEDQEFATIPCCYAKTIAAFDLFIYQYLVGNSEQSVSYKNQVKRITHLERVAINLLNYKKENAELPSLHIEYLKRKTEAVILSYYVVSCIINPDKVAGRKMSNNMYKSVRLLWPDLFRATRSKYWVYRLFSWFRVGPESYQKIIHSMAFRLVRRNHGIEKEN